MIRFYMEMGVWRMTTTEAAWEEAKQVYITFYHDAEFCVSLNTIHRMLRISMTIYARNHWRKSGV
ncbi:hypothetical protein DPMN_155887 [Dreissena polymorpha]|uniref:Uncharacterized protein n=1 Tax=Dreissena polymorpha TaxID=45954 RepID=A0A9D4FR80_DREPO|nr:hypothetical protein DPMN_155887 [Dreissena polymorpha]